MPSECRAGSTLVRGTPRRRRWGRPPTRGPSAQPRGFPPLGPLTRRFPQEPSLLPAGELHGHVRRPSSITSAVLGCATLVALLYVSPILAAPARRGLHC